MPRHSSIALILFASVLPCAAFAQEDEVLDLGTLILSAAGVAVDPLTAPASVTVVTGQDLEDAGFTDLTDAVRNVPGVFVDGGADAENITFRGLRPEDTLILIDGQRVNTRQTRTNGSGGVDQFYVPPASAIDRIEIVRGPMSSLYGSDALGGVINIITKPVAEEWTGSLTLEGTSPVADEDSSERQASYYLSGPILRDTLGLQLWGRTLDRDASERDGGAKERNLTEHTARLTWTPVPDHEVFLQYGQTDISRTTVGTRGNTIREDERKTLSFGYEGLVAGWDTTVLLAHEAAKRETPTSTAGRIPELSTTTLDVKASRSFYWNGIHQFTLGGQYLKAELTDLNIGLGDGVHYDFSNTQIALFVEDIWEITDRFELTVGARYTDDERFGGKITPRIYALYEISPDFYLSGGIATGYKTPEIRDANDTYFLPTGGRGSNDLIQGNPDLSPEESTSYEIGLRFESDRLTAAATLYRTDFENKIETFDTGTQITLNGSTFDLFTYGNIDSVRNQGLELSAGYFITPQLEISGSFTFTDSEQRSGDLAGQPLTRTPKRQASLRLDWQTPMDGLDVWAEARYSGEAINATSSSRGITVTALDSYATLDIGVRYAINDNVTLRGAILNVADANINSDDHGTTRNGRTLWVSLTTEF